MNVQDATPVKPVPFWRRTWVRVVASIVTVLVIVFCCCLPLSMYAWSQRDVVFAPWQTETSAPTTSEEVAIQEDDGYRKFRPDAQWIGDDFGPERTLPGTVSGPAIVELKSHMGSVCGLVKVNSGETLVWPGGGAYWEAGSQLALDARWPHHKDEYINHYSNCNVYSSAVDVPNPTK